MVDFGESNSVPPRLTKAHRMTRTHTFAAKLLLLAVLTLLPCGCSSTSSSRAGRSADCGVDMAPGGEGPRILFIGNSLTYWFDVPGMLAALMHASAMPFERIATRALPDYGLPDHWNSKATRQVLAEGWDLVILQQGPSATEGRPYLLEYARSFADEIRRRGGTPAMLMVWPSAARSFDFDGVRDSYTMAAERVDAYLFPAGMAWQAAWARDAELELYGPDGFHPSPLGSLLTAMTIFAGLGGSASRPTPAEICVKGHGPLELSTELRALMEDAVAEANAEFGRVPSR